MRGRTHRRYSGISLPFITIIIVITSLATALLTIYPSGLYLALPTSECIWTPVSISGLPSPTHTHILAHSMDFRGACWRLLLFWVPTLLATYLPTF